MPSISLLCSAIFTRFVISRYTPFRHYRHLQVTLIRTSYWNKKTQTNTTKLRFYQKYGARYVFFIAGMISTIASGALPLCADLGFWPMIATRFFQVRKCKKILENLKGNYYLAETPPCAECPSFPHYFFQISSSRLSL